MTTRLDERTAPYLRATAVALGGGCLMWLGVVLRRPLS